MTVVPIEALQVIYRYSAQTMLDKQVQKIPFTFRNPYKCPHVFALMPHFEVKPAATGNRIEDTIVAAPEDDSRRAKMITFPPTDENGLTAYLDLGTWLSLQSNDAFSDYAKDGPIIFVDEDLKVTPGMTDEQFHKKYVEYLEKLIDGDPKLSRKATTVQTLSEPETAPAPDLKPPSSKAETPPPPDPETVTFEANAVTSKQLQTLDNIGKGIGDRVVKERKANGPYASVQNVQDRLKLSDRYWDSLRPHLWVKTDATAAIADDVTLDAA